MTGLVRAELRKYTTTRLMWGMAIAIFVVGAGFAAIFAGVALYAPLGDGLGTLADIVPGDVLTKFVYLSHIQLGYLLVLCIGVVVIGQEFRHKTATSTFLAEPHRPRVIGAKCMALAVIGAVNGLLFLVGSLIGAGILLGINGEALFPDPGGLLRAFALALLVLVLWTWIGLGVGVLISNQIVALLVAIAFVWIVEPLVTFALSFVDWGPELTRFFPGSVSTAALDLSSGIPGQVAQEIGMSATSLSWGVGALLLVAYAAAMALIGLVLTQRRDIG